MPDLLVAIWNSVSLDAGAWIGLISLIVAFMLAFYTVREQRKIARKQATIDLALATFVEGYDVDTFLDLDRVVFGLGPVSSAEVKPVLRGLLIYNMMATGIQSGIFDERTCFEQDGEYVARFWKRVDPWIELQRASFGTPDQWRNFTKVGKRWHRRVTKKGPLIAGHLPPGTNESAP